MAFSLPNKSKPPADLFSARLESALAFLHLHWKNLTNYAPGDANTLIGLPNPYIVPATPRAEFTFQEQYYWDSYFTAIGYNGPDAPAMIEGMLENLTHLLDRFGMIPSANRMYFTSRSQPPLLTSYIFHVYDTQQKSIEWLHDYIVRAHNEYRDVWMSDHHPHWRSVGGLNRYYDINALHDLAEAESGWDMTTRFERKCLDYLPIDLNALLFRYETDFARASEIFNDQQSRNEWLEVAQRRKEWVDSVMWNTSKGMYFDYNYIKRSASGVWSLASYYPLWAGMASLEQAAAMVRNLSKFLQKGGLTATSRPVVDMSIFGSVKTQWAYPNGWAPLHFMVTEGLERYGYSKEASQIALLWLGTNLDWFERHGEFIEKYNVVSPGKEAKDGVYPGQAGFAWTNAIFVYYAHKYGGINYNL